MPDVMEVLPVDGMDEIVQEFLVESHENLDQLDQDLVALESEPGSRALLSSIFRTIHTIKGTSGFLGLVNLEKVSHAGENLLAELRDGARTMDRPTTDVLLLLVDKLREMLASIEAGTGDDVDAEETVAAIVALQNGEQASSDAAAGTPDETEPGDAEPDAADVAATPTADAPAAEEPPATPESATATQVEPAPQPAAPSAPSPAPAAETKPAPSTVPAATDGDGELPVTRPTAADSSVRVDVSLLDALMRQVGELVLVRNQIERMVAATEHVELARTTQQLNLISGELQEGVMKTRMQPIDHLWAKMPRIVRDLASALGREVNLVMEGRETELDRSLLEAVKDPLTHLVRNAVDHGIEAPDVRVANGKPAKGTVVLRAYHAGGQVVVEIADDGKGIDAVAVARTAVARGLRTADQVQNMSPGEIYDLLFQPGFSTAEKVTNISGRGVGMDVVRSKVEAIGGSVDVESQPGNGTTWRLRIPLTLAIMPALTVDCGGEVFAVAQINLLELVAVDDREGSSQIEYVGNAPVYRLRGALLPLVSLADVLDVESNSSSGVIAVMQVDEQRFGLLVDRVLNTEEIVVKAVSSRIKQIGLYSGATVLGDGTVALILDVQAVARRALNGEIAEMIRTQNRESSAVEESGEQLLVVSIGEGRRVALPLDSVTRLERMPAARVERVGSREVIQYRGELLPLARLDSVLGAFGSEDSEELLVVVVGGGNGRQLAVVVSEILDIVSEDTGERSEIDDVGLLGSTVVSERVTELLDLDGLLRSIGHDPLNGSMTSSDLRELDVHMAGA